ncbi:MAG TPA: NAD(P)/FAD-dependent oxidoreductase [Candidatus Nanoarchaeia archaeon]|uniref:NAD(P)/FAD-dependent oxidoreductase n=1 Tax=Candidatus Iainarchaeum sp. TaxID=3101447 RepID=A0A8T4KRJ4_9ARCH|nr:NAD(P)/FAD-dependent oxidoreductase [Candidatus Diapherotrites archaeon]HLD19152.1 NAD(P)/FAD-dependent oxidoreductase [Candidatus Nanoarchaeia archaeon]
MHDVLIVGGGLAGLSAAVACRQHNLSTMLVSRRLGGSLLETPIIDTLPGVGAVFGPELAKKLAEQAASLGVESREAEIIEIRSGFTLFNVTDHSGEKHKAKVVIIACGRPAKMLEVMGEEEFLGKGITTNPITDYGQLKGGIVAVNGHDQRAAAVALWLANSCEKVHLISSSPRLNATPLANERLNRTLRIEQHLNTNIKQVIGSLSLESIMLDRGQQIKLSGLVLTQRGAPQLSFLKAPVQISDGIVVDSEMKTSHKGIFACGEVLSTKNAMAPEIIAQAWAAAESAYKFVRK